MSSKKILIIGQNSFIGRSFAAECDTNKIKYETCRHNKIPINFSLYHTIVNFSINPAFYSNAYSKTLDQDSQIAERIATYPSIKFVMISSRAVYPIGASLVPIKETVLLKKSNQRQYGLNKIRSEQNCTEILGTETLIVIRPANVFGFEKGRGTFMGIALSRLKSRGEILLDIKRESIRDFIPVSEFSRYLLKLILADQSGIFNVGSGHGLAVGEVCRQLIEGYGQGTIITTEDADISDQFILDTKKLTSATDYYLTEGSILDDIRNIGIDLRD